MDIVLLSGGLGNQMSQYAFAVAKKIKNQVRINTYLLRREYVHQGYELQRVFEISEDFDGKIDLICRFFRKILYLKGRCFFLPLCECIFAFLKMINIHLICERYDYLFDSSLLNCKSGLNLYLGGWHSEKYYCLVEKEIRSLFKFDVGKLNVKSFNLKEQLDNCNAVSLHVRRGDYVNELNKNKFGDICSIEYYRKSINYIRKRVDNPVFIVFSDDIEWTKNNIYLENCIYVDWNKGKDSWQDMCLMSFCKHNINANSTFSWWGAWLNNNRNKIVIVPNSFIRGISTPDLYPEKWIKI
ncbi:alpha-1,2-fucosyltransferase [Parabacteroides goldsteinii]|jgi:hypothetical protein|uniref:alpha-1,2-fucosyltransferase n=1 Tax=Parabacteroides goldsteinii TaxID=328812 RepID=UPI001E0E6BE0|nr:alpha-1,2-fucosyltransferase [Parabacteroides goldsteinii]MBS6577346.1 alpha-1,2-fucosyltransferase [Parabacteroides goldsteinii]